MHTYDSLMMDSSEYFMVVYSKQHIDSSFENGQVKVLENTMQEMLK